MVQSKPENIMIGKRIKSIRISKGIDLAKFGKMVNPPASASIVSRWERGINLPNSQRIKSIAEIGNVSVNFLLNGTQMSIKDIKKFQSTLSRDNLTDEEKKRIKEISIETRSAVQSVNEPFDKISRQVFKDSFLSDLSPEKRILANHISILLSHISASEVSDNFLEDLTVYLNGITCLLSGSISKKDFEKYQNDLSKDIDKNFE
ncbi:helix-turn-helix domain-containing protein [Levilactobacillus brevis]|uniref:helix-turn-helix domain-containing protein n=1 Tax=Levilactobacillus brevis TaxID=1580 RepID=UPI000B3F7B17|nr:helix-turn-helix transcriptional regulator [Levilactobacillus brevis]